MIEFGSIYRVGWGFLRGALHVRARDEIADPFALARAEVRPESPVVFEHHSGGRPRDLIGTTQAVVQLVSDRVIEILRSEAFTGWTTFPVTIYGKQGEVIEGYHGFAVTGRSGPIDKSRSQRVVLKPLTPQGQPIPGWRGLFFDPATWDGSDIFTPEGTGFVFVVERVKDALERARIKNFYFQRLTEFERSWS